VCRNEDHRHPRLSAENPPLKVQSRHATQLHVDNEAHGGSAQPSIQELFGRGVKRRLEPCGAKQAPKRRPHAGIILDDSNN
jgi:hypothetical protein